MMARISTSHQLLKENTIRMRLEYAFTNSAQLRLQVYLAVRPVVCRSILDKCCKETSVLVIRTCSNIHCLHKIQEELGAFSEI